MRHLIVPSACLALLATTALAQTPPPPPAIGVTAPTAWGQQADIQGIVKAFKMTPVGDLEGTILTDGTEVHVPPHLSSQLAAVVRPGEAVRVLGWRSSVPNSLSPGRALPCVTPTISYRFFRFSSQSCSRRTRIRRRLHQLAELWSVTRVQFARICRRRTPPRTSVNG
jgi:hypothetical protein